MSKKVLLDRRAVLVKEADGYFNAATASGGLLSAEHAARDEEIEKEIKQIDASLAGFERQAERQRSVGAVAEDDTSKAPGNDKKFSSFGDFMMGVMKADLPAYRNKAVDERLQYGAGPTGMNEGVGADGGFLVQTDHQSELLQNVWQSGEILSRIRKIQVGPNSNGVSFNGVDETSRATGSRWGGIRTFWTPEAGLKNASQPKFKKIKLDLFKLTAMCYATDELLQDASALRSWISQAFKDEMEFAIEDAIVSGTGAGMPLGFLNSGATITVPKETSQIAKTIVAENILNMWSRMPSKMRRNAVWLVNQDIEPQLLQMSIKIKNVAGTENVGGFPAQGVVYVPAGTNGSEFGSLMGRPVVPVEYASTLGTAGDIVLADLSQYIGIEKDGVEEASSIHVRFIYDETAFRFVYRFNGQPIWSVPMTPYKGTATQSPFVALATRS